MRSYDRDHFITMAFFAAGLLPEQESEVTKAAKASLTATKDLDRAIKLRDFDPGKRVPANEVLRLGREVSAATEKIRTEIEPLIG